MLTLMMIITFLLLYLQLIEIFLPEDISENKLGTVK